MNWEQLFSTVVQLAIFSLFITSIIEVVKGISASGIMGLVKGLWNTLIANKQMDGNAFPVMNFVVALLCCWAFNITIMSSIFQTLLTIQEKTSTPVQMMFARWIDYFGTASLTYLGSDQLFKRFLAVEKGAKETFEAAKV
jgi:hypothetical protein